MKPFDFDKYIKNNPLLKESKALKESEDDYDDDERPEFDSVEDVVSAFASKGAKVEYNENTATVTYIKKGKKGKFRLSGDDPEDAETAYEELADLFPQIASKL